MKPLIVLLASFAIDFLFQYTTSQQPQTDEAGRTAMCCMLIFTAIGHFKFSTGMSEMIPPKIPFRTTLVYISGIYEVIAGIALLIEPLRLLAAWSLITFFVVSLPLNIHAARLRLDYETGEYNGKGKTYLWFRIPLQVLFITWVYLCAIFSR